MRYIEIKAPSKINIGLNVLEKRKDGYHNIYTLFYPIYDLYDTLTFELSDSFEFSSNSPFIHNDKDNLIIKAKVLLEEFTRKKINAKINLTKRIPIGAGLGGGSSDAAATLISLNELFKLNLINEQLIHLALELGSDVPFFIKAKPAIGKSRGEILEHIPFQINYPILIINPKIHISTKEAYQNIMPCKNEFDYKEIIHSKTINFSLLREKVKNDFEEFVFNKYPQIKKIKEILYSNDALFASMSGSGSTVFGIFENINKAKAAKECFPQEYFCWISIPQD